MPTIIIKDENGVDETYENVNTVKFRTPENTTVSFKYNPGTEYPYKDGQYRVRFLDYNGDVLKVQWVDVGDAASYPATNPQHDGLTFIGWNYTLAQLSDINGNIDVGAIYRSTSASGGGVTNETTSNIITIELHNGNLQFALRPYYTGSLTWEIDWGDGTVETKSVTNGSTSDVGSTVTYYHTYASAGSYTVTMTKTAGTGTYWFGYFGSSSSSSSNICGGNNSNCVRTITLDQSLTKIGCAAFYTLGLMSLCVLPPNATGYTGNPLSYTFSGCYALQSVTIPNGVTSIGQYAFANSFSLQSVTIPSSVTSIGSFAFYCCYALQSVTIPNGVTSIGRYAFTYSCSLQSVTIPNGVTSIEQYAFAYIYSLQSVNIPSSVTSIGQYAFANSFSLQSVTIPSSVTSIGESAFYCCYALQSVFLSSTTPPSIVTSTFSNTYGIFYVPMVAVNTYRTATNWTAFATRIMGY